MCEIKFKKLGEAYYAIIIIHHILYLSIQFLKTRLLKINLFLESHLDLQFPFPVHFFPPFSQNNLQQIPFPKKVFPGLYPSLNHVRDGHCHTCTKAEGFIYVYLVYIILSPYMFRMKAALNYTKLLVFIFDRYFIYFSGA